MHEIKLFEKPEFGQVRSVMVGDEALKKHRMQKSMISTHANSLTLLNT